MTRADTGDTGTLRLNPDLGMYNNVPSLLIDTLLVAVPLWIDRLRHHPHAVLHARATVCADQLAHHADTLMYKGKTASERRTTIETFNRLAEGLAIGAYASGGITYEGHHWCVGSAHMGVRQDDRWCEAELAREATGRPHRTATTGGGRDHRPVTTATVLGDVL